MELKVILILLILILWAYYFHLYRCVYSGFMHSTYNNICVFGLFVRSFVRGLPLHFIFSLYFSFSLSNIFYLFFSHTFLLCLSFVVLCYLNWIINAFKWRQKAYSLHEIHSYTHFSYECLTFGWKCCVVQTFYSFEKGKKFNVSKIDVKFVLK